MIASKSVDLFIAGDFFGLSRTDSSTLGTLGGLCGHRGN